MDSYKSLMNKGFVYDWNVLDNKKLTIKIAKDEDSKLCVVAGIDEKTGLVYIITEFEEVKNQGEASE